MVNRSYHSLTTTFNVLFNGEEAFDVGASILSQVHDDNFFEVLEVEPIVVNGERMDQTTIVPGFARAEEKAVKAIQKHSMNINGVQHNNKIDEAYLLLGKARYFDRRFFPAMEAFNYLLENYADQSTYVEGRIWREKTNIRLKNNELAIKNLRSLARAITPKSRFHSPANATLCQAFINTEQLDSACYYIRNAAQSAKNNDKRGRYYFLTGQLYEKLQKPDSALWAYEQVVGLNRKTPRPYWINAQIKRLQIRSIRDSIDPIESYEKLAKNYENFVYDHWINRAIGIHYFEQQKDSLGKHYLNLSLRSAHIDLPTKKANYRDLANFNFEGGRYVDAGAYLDSLLVSLADGTAIKRKTQRERDNLNGVIKYEEIVRVTDSLLYITSMDKEAQLTFFEEHIRKKETRALDKVTADEKSSFPFFGRSNKENVFYFYNPMLVVRGQQQFLSTWGDRPNTDNWAIASAIRLIPEQTNGDGTEEQEEPEAFFVEKPENYVNTLPKTPSEIDSIKKLNHNAYLQLGMIYKESFKNNELAKARLDHLLTLEPSAELAAPAYYHRYKIYESEKSPKAKAYFNIIVNEYPDSPYGLLLSSENINSSLFKTPDTVYENLLKTFQNADFDLFFEQAQAYSVLLNGTPIQPKFDLLMAHYNGRLKGRKAWANTLEDFVLKYPETPEANRAQEMIGQLNLTDSLEREKIVYLNYKWIFTFKSADSLSLNNIKTEIEKALTAIPDNGWFLSVDRFNETETYLVLHGIRDRRQLNEWKKHLKNEGSSVLDSNNFVVLSADYKRMLLDKTPTTHEK